MEKMNGQKGHGIVQVENKKKNPLEAMADRFQSPGAIITLGITMILFFLATAAVEYSIRFVATNLAIVEATEDSGRIALSSVEPDAPLHKAPLLSDFDGEDQKLALPEAESTLPTQPITRKLRTTFALLHSVGGFRSRFRGLRFAAFYAFITAILSLLFQLVFSAAGPVGFWLANTLAAVLSCNFHAAWTHATIAAPSDKRFSQLVPQLGRQLILPTIRLQATIGAMHLSTVGALAWVVNQVHDERVPRWVAANLAFLPIAVAAITGFLLVLPSYIALVRIEASLLPEDASAIVPFDRTFGGRMTVSEDTPKRCAAFKAVTVRGAYMLFGRETYKRVAKMQVKFVAISMAVTFAFAAVVAAEVFVIAGGEKNIREFAKYAHDNMA